eukprot:6212684-Pleurochrysis_carterae.AAC.2
MPRVYRGRLLVVEASQYRVQAFVQHRVRVRIAVDVCEEWSRLARLAVARVVDLVSHERRRGVGDLFAAVR